MRRARGCHRRATHSGQFLTTNGTAASWTAVTATTLLPAQATHSGQFLTTDGAGVLSWAAGSGVTLGAFSSTPSTDGLTLSSGTLNLDPADGTHAGGVSATTQTFGGVKTIGGVVIDALGFLNTYPAISWGAYGTGISADGANGQLFALISTARAGAFKVYDGAVNILVLNNTSMDLTGLGVGGSIKLKSPDGTAYTATIANGGTWSIA